MLWQLLPSPAECRQSVARIHLIWNRARAAPRSRSFFYPWVSNASQPKPIARSQTESHDMRWIEAIEIAHRFGAKVPNCHVAAPAAQCWIDRIAALPIAQQQGRLAEAIAEANHYTGLSEP